MNEVKLVDWIVKPKNNQILMFFYNPKTPTEAQRELDINKLNLKPFLQRGLLKCLNPDTHKGRLYILTNKSRKLLKIQNLKPGNKNNYNLIGWILASPRQRYVVLITMGKVKFKRTSEEIRIRSSKINSCLTRISTKEILKELVEKELVDSEMGDDRRRYYWITQKGISIAGDLN